MKIVVDAMGGDHAPDINVEGAVVAGKRLPQAQISLVGQPEAIRESLKRKRLEQNFEIVPAQDFIRMDESPGSALRKRDQCSLKIAAEMVKEGRADAMVSAGNTGALLQFALLGVGRIRGVRRPALTAVLPTKAPTIALDMGANAECKPEYLPQFAMMGSLYAQYLYGRQKPRVGLLNIGTEKGKGNNLVQESFELLQETKGITFVGNVEPTGIFEGSCDVIVCDGFTGNMMLKTAEAVSSWIMSRIKEAATQTPVAMLGGTLLKSSLKGLRQDVRYQEQGGALLLGLQGAVVKCHGGSDSLSITNGIEGAYKTVEARLVERISQAIEKGF